ncbi:hypothetical protein E2562_015200 [Oryza meyeriana var. granulata]|uniref:DUF834 domain-containing protein n=1 Tax=Oryza meyeriana var. granulata TaxID=110450 RepID=A0A6G1EWR8_9ORYZ|nr:hypothetical protein E2562_015200 [Oryza meyeriana var. granulata]
MEEQVGQRGSGRGGSREKPPDGARMGFYLGRGRAHRGGGGARYGTRLLLRAATEKVSTAAPSSHAGRLHRDPIDEAMVADLELELEIAGEDDGFRQSPRRWPTPLSPVRRFSRRRERTWTRHT